MQSIDLIRDSLIAEYLDICVMAQQPAPRIPRQQREQHKAEVRAYQEKNRLLTPRSMLQPVRVRISARPPEEKEIISDEGFKGSIIKQYKPTPRKEKSPDEVIELEFFHHITALMIEENPKLDITEARSYADKLLQSKHGRIKPYSLLNVIKHVEELKQYPEFEKYNDLQLVRRIQTPRQPRKPYRTIREVYQQRADEITNHKEALKSFKSANGEYIPPQPPQIIPKASLTAVFNTA